MKKVKESLMEYTVKIKKLPKSCSDCAFYVEIFEDTKVKNTMELKEICQLGYFEQEVLSEGFLEEYRYPKCKLKKNKKIRIKQMR